MKRSTAVALSSLALGGLTFATSRADWLELWWRFSGPELAWPTVESYELDIDVSVAGRFETRAQVELSGIEGDRVTLLLNRSLDVGAASVDGVAVDVEHFRRLPSRYHSEGRVVEFTLPRAAEDGRVTLDLSYGGEAELGRKGPDWRGILFVDTDEVRMCEQTIFYPQVPLSLEGSTKAKAPFRVEVLAPKDLEIFVPAAGGPTEGPTEGLIEVPKGTRRWSFESKNARHPALLGGIYQRTETVIDGSRIVTLLRCEHAELAQGMVHEARGAFEAYTRRFGAIEDGVIGIVEIHCRDSSYNWAAEGVVTFDRGALSGRVPVLKMAHEIAHLWWGQSAEATGPGERFLTEGLAEYSAWSYLIADGRANLVQWSLSSARRKVAALTVNGKSRALADVGFGGADYTTLAYDKGALVLHCLGAQLGPGQLDDALRRLVDVGRGRQVTLHDFEAAVRAATGQEPLTLPWLHGAGDLNLRLEQTALLGGRVSAVIVAELAPGSDDIQAAGTPVAILLGGRGWQERHTWLLDGTTTELAFEIGERELAYLRLDPGEGWTSNLEGGFVVLDGAQQVDASPAGEALVDLGGTHIELRFDRALTEPDLDALRLAQLPLAPGGEARFDLLAAGLKDAGRTLVIETGPWLPGQRYQLATTSLLDQDGLPVVPTPYTLQVAPSTDEQSARIVKTFPEVGSFVSASGGKIEIVITLDEPMRKGYAITGRGVREIEASGYLYPKLVGGGRWDADAHTIRWSCKDLEVGSTYALPIRARTFHDLSGNGCEELDLVFTIVGEDD